MNQIVSCNIRNLWPTTVGLKLIFEGKDEPISILRYAWIGTIRFEEL